MTNEGKDDLKEKIEELVCGLIIGEPGSDYDIFMVEQLSDEFIAFLVKNQELISKTLYK